MVSGFTLMDSVTGISISSGGSPTIVSNAIVNCGTGIICDSGSIDRRGSPVIRGNTITGCSGTAIQLSFTGTPLVEANLLEENGGGIGMWEAGNVTIRNNVIRRNRGDGFLMYNYSNADILQNLIVENGGSGVSWVAPQGARGPWLINNTIPAPQPTAQIF
jgi:parallel beta-helix repeat protein